MKVAKEATTQGQQPAMEQKSRKNDRASSRKFVLAHLDRRQVKDCLVRPDDPLAFVRPFVRQKQRYSQSFLGKKVDGDAPYYIIKLNNKQPDVREAERITNFLFGNSDNGVGNESCEEEWQTFNDESYSERYYASAILFPIADKQGSALAYLLGNWNNMISRESIDRDFGVRTTASRGMSKDTDGKPLQTIKSATMGSYRDENATLHFTKQRRTLGEFTEVNQAPVGSNLEGLRLKPSKNSTLFDGKNTLSFNNPLPGKNATNEEYIESLRKEAFYLYDIYKNDPVAKDFEGHFDSRVNPNSETARQLIINLDKHWDEYVENKIITESVYFWSVIGRLPRKNKFTGKDSVKKAIRKGKSSASVKVGNEEIGILNLVRVSCIQLNESDKYYRMEEGQWYEMAHSMIEKMKEAIRCHFINSDDLHLMPAESITQGEGLYNEKAVVEINRVGPSEKLSALLLDKKNVELRWRNKFELADILLMKKRIKNDQQISLIHVKKHLANSLAHHCHQLTRSASFISDNLDRTPVATCFKKCFIDRLYDELINQPEKKERFTDFQKKIDKKDKKIPCQGVIDEMIDLYVNEEGRDKVETDRILEIKEMIGREDWKEIVEKVSKYGDAIYLWIDCMVDYVSLPKVPASTKPMQVEMRASLEKFLGQLEEYDVFTTWTKGILPRGKKSIITFVLAIITNEMFDDYMIDNRVHLIHDAMRAVQNCKFRFKITFIPVREKGKRQLQKKSGKAIGADCKKAKMSSSRKGNRKSVKPIGSCGKRGSQSAKRGVQKLVVPTTEENLPLDGKMANTRHPETVQIPALLAGSDPNSGNPNLEQTSWVNGDVTVIPEAGKTTTNNVLETMQAGVSTVRKLTNVLIGKEDVINAAHSSKDVTISVENVKKSAGPSRKRAENLGTSPVSKKSSKKRRVENSEGCPMMKRWLKMGA